MLRRWTGIRSRALLLDLALSAVLLLGTWVKLSYFNFPPLQRLESDWNPWYLTQAVQAALATLATLSVVLSPVILLSTSRRVAALAGASLLSTLLVAADVVHFRFYGDILSAAAVGEAWQIGLIYKSILHLLEPRDVLLALDLGVAACLWPASHRAGRDSRPPLPSVPRNTVPRLVAGGLLLAALIPIRIVALDRGDTFRYNHFRFHGARKIGLLNYHLYEGGARIYRDVLGVRQVNPADRARATAFLARWSEDAYAPSPLFGVAQGRNVVLIMVESLHAFPIGLRIGGREVTPNLNALAANSLHFTRFFDQTWEGTTSDGEFTSLQSLHPLPSGSVATTFPANDYRGIPEVLSEQGYATLSAHAYFGALWNMRQMHQNLGFSRSLFREAFATTEEFNMGLSDAEFFRQTVPQLERLPQPFMAYLMTLSTHHPFELPRRHKVLDLGEFEGTSLGDYLHTVRYLDAALGEFLAALETDGLLARSMLVIYGDHKADLGDPDDLARLLSRHDGLPGLPRPAAGSTAALWLEQRRLPLLIHIPGVAAQSRYEASGGHLDIAPTVLNLLGIGGEPMPTLGRDLTRGENSLVVFRDGGFVEGDVFCVRVAAGEAESRCFEYSTGRALAAADYADRLRTARERLDISDLVVRGNLFGPARRSAPGNPARTSRGESGPTAGPGT